MTTNTGIIPATWSGPLLSILRIVTGLLFIAHGTAKHLGFPQVAMFDGLQTFSLGGIAGLLELFGGALIIIGLFTRIAAFVLSGLMAFAYFLAHAPQGFHPILNGGELAVLYCFIFLYFAAAGPGPWAVDARKSP